VEPRLICWRRPADWVANAVNDLRSRILLKEIQLRLVANVASAAILEPQRFRRHLDYVDEVRAAKENRAQGRPVRQSDPEPAMALSLDAGHVSTRLDLGLHAAGGVHDELGLVDEGNVPA